MVSLVAVLMLAGASVHAQSITQNFGSGASVFSIEFVTIGDPGNEPDTTGSPNPVGSVSYVFNLGKYEISRDMIEKANQAGNLEITLADMNIFGGNGVNRPATGITWTEAAKFVNYLNTSKNYQAAYNIDPSGNFQVWNAGQFSGTNQFRHKDAYYFLPSVDEWHKGAYGSPSRSWYNYTTGSDTAPTGVSGGFLSGTIVSAQAGPADITVAGGLSAYGTMAQGGNVWEWNENAYAFPNEPAAARDLRGGSFYENFEYSEASARSEHPEWRDIFSIGFRVASVPEPSSLSLLLAGGLVTVRRRKRT